MQWKLSDDRPIYLQLMETITAAIASGTLAAGSRLPSVREMAAQAGQLRRERAQDIAQRAESGGNNQQNGEFFIRFHGTASFCGAVRTVSA